MMKLTESHLIVLRWTKMRTAGLAPTMARVVITLLFSVETFSRGLLLAIIPLKVFSFVGTMQGVALFYVAGAIVGLETTC